MCCGKKAAQAPRQLEIAVDSTEQLANSRLLLNGLKVKAEKIKLGRGALSAVMGHCGCVEFHKVRRVCRSGLRRRVGLVSKQRAQHAPPDFSRMGHSGRAMRGSSVRSEARPFVPDSDAPFRGLDVTTEAPADLHASVGQVADADWSGLDKRGHAIFTRGGQLFRRDAHGKIGGNRRANHPKLYFVQFG